MGDDAAHEAQVLASWQANATPWADAVRARAIESRRLVTDQAIIEAVRSRAPRSVLDLGCGEGWLARALSPLGIDVLGLDVVPQLVEAAQRAGGGRFCVGDYSQLIADAASGVSRCDAVVCNFALFGAESVVALFRDVPRLLTPGGTFIVQTLHPWTAGAEAPYRDGWREGSWQGFPSAFHDPPPWYFRTLQSWIQLHSTCGLRLIELREPQHPASARPASVIFLSSVAAG